jgi:hypothetical protein
MGIFVTATVLAQAPNAFNYQSVVRDNLGQPIVNQTISLRCSILDSTINGKSVYTEVHHPTTNQFGLITLSIGKGTVLNGNFSLIKWNANSKFIKIELDIKNGNNYIIVSTSQLLSVPYSLQSDNTSKIQGKNISFNSPRIGQVLMWNGTEWSPVDNINSSINTMIYLSNF